MPFNGRVLWVKLFVKEMANKSLLNPLYTLSAIEIKRQPPGLEIKEFGGSSSEGASFPADRPEGFGEKFAAMLRRSSAGWHRRCEAQELDFDPVSRTERV